MGTSERNAAKQTISKRQREEEGDICRTFTNHGSRSGGKGITLRRHSKWMSEDFEIRDCMGEILFDA